MIIFKCNYPQCNKVFTSSSNLSRHAMIHSNAKPFVCPEVNCHKSFNQKINLKKHLKLHETAYQNMASCQSSSSFQSFNYHQLSNPENTVDSPNLILNTATEFKLLYCCFCIHNQFPAKFNSLIALRSHLFQHIPNLTSDTIALSIVFQCIMSIICTWNFRTTDEKVFLDRHDYESCSLLSNYIDPIR